MKDTKGLLIASAAAALFFSGAIQAAEPAATGATEAKIKCSGINSCKGSSECKTATTSCKGTNSCKGKGWVHASKEECAAKGGKEVRK